MVPHSFISNQLCTLGLYYVTFNVVKLMFIAFFFNFMCVTMMVLNICVNEVVQLL